MSRLTEWLNDIFSPLQTKLNTGNGAVTADDIVKKIHEVVDPQIAGLNAALAAIHATDDDTEKKLNDVTDVIAKFTATFAPASAPAAANTNTPTPPPPPAPTPEPVPVAPAPSPEPSPEEGAEKPPAE